MSKCNVRRKPNIMPENVAYCIATEILLKKENLLLLVCFWEFGCVVLKKSNRTSRYKVVSLTKKDVL